LTVRYAVLMGLKNKALGLKNKPQPNIGTLLIFDGFILFTGIVYF